MSKGGSDIPVPTQNGPLGNVQDPWVVAMAKLVKLMSPVRPEVTVRLKKEVTNKPAIAAQIGHMRGLLQSPDQDSAAHLQDLSKLQDVLNYLDAELSVIRKTAALQMQYMGRIEMRDRHLVGKYTKERGEDCTEVEFQVPEVGCEETAGDTILKFSGPYYSNLFGDSVNADRPNPMA
ncbi:MAG: hypothetical protein MMC23_010137 [Stictis urceolatum]|nr:hypothetical protein [Stictis urceolata]